MALDLVRMKTVNDVTGDDIYTGATDQPSLYGVMKGFDEKKWTVTFNVVPCENIEMNLPVVDNDTNANYAGIAGYAMSMKLKSSPEEYSSYDVLKEIEEIPLEVSELRFKHFDPSDVTDLTLSYRYLKELVIEDNAFPYLSSFSVVCPLLRNFTITDGSMSSLASSRRLMELNGYFRLNTPNLMLMTVGIQSLWNFLAMSVTQISSSFMLELGAYSMSNITRVEYMVEIPMDIVTHIQTTIEKNEGHSGSVVIVPINPVVTPTPTPTPTPEPWFPIYDPFILGDNCNYVTPDVCKQEIISETNVTRLYLAIRDAYPTKALAHTRVITLAGVDKINVKLWRESLSKQVKNPAPIDLYIMHDPIKGRTISTELALLHLKLAQFTRPRILYIGDGTLYREGFLEVLQYMHANNSNGWFQNLEEIYVVKNYIVTYDYATEGQIPGYAANLTRDIVDLLYDMCTDKVNFPKLRYINLNMNGYNLVGAAGFQEELINACPLETGVTIEAYETLVKYPVFCMDDNGFQSQTMTRTYYYDMNDEKDAAQCRFNWNWEMIGMFNNDITGPYPLPSTPNCPGYETPATIEPAFP